MSPCLPAREHLADGTIADDNNLSGRVSTPGEHRRGTLACGEAILTVWVAVQKAFSKTSGWSFE